MSKIGLVLAVFIAHELLAQMLLVVPNYGISFGFMGSGVLIILIGMLLVWWCWTRGYWIMALGGAVNLYDRFRFGFVRDYWHLPIVDLYNNLADWIIFLGLVLLGLSVWRNRR